MSLFGRFFAKEIKIATRQAFEGPEIQSKLDQVVSDVVANHKGVQFIKAMQVEMLRVDPTMDIRLAWEVARRGLVDFMNEEKIQFGDDRYDWSKDGAASLIHAIEIEYWETAS